MKRDSKMTPTPGLCPCSPSHSTASSNSTSTEILAAKLDLLDQQWSAHKAQSPIKIVNPRKRHHSTRRSEQSSGNHVGNDRTSSNRDSKNGDSAHLNQSMVDAEDDSSVGHSSVSTLGSTESVFDRLYRQRTGSLRKSTSKPCEASNSHGDSVIARSKDSGSSNRRGSFGSPVTMTRLNNSTRNRKDRLGAYSNSSIDAKSVGYASTTRRRRTPQNSSHSCGHHSNRHHRNDGSSVASTLSGGSGFDGDDSNSVFARLYRNEKRSEKLWRKPREFTPKLPPTSKRSSKNKGIHRSGDEIGQKSRLPNLNKSHEKEQQFQNRRIRKADDTPKEGQSDGLKIVPFSKDDFDAIDELGKHLENIYDGCSPTVALTSASSMNWDESPGSKHFNQTQQRPITVQTASVNTEKDAEALQTVKKEPEQSELNQRNILGSNDDISFKKSIHHNMNSTTESGAETIAKETELISLDNKIGIPHTDTKSKRKENYENSHQTIIPSSENSNIMNTDNATNDCGFYSLKQSCQSFSLEKKFFVKRIDRLSSPMRRRNRKSVGNMKNNQTEPLFTPRRLRFESAITIQRAFRLHRAELELASAMIQSLTTDMKFHEKNKTLIHSPVHRQHVLQKAVRAVKCWWILEGLHIEDDWITLAWENEVSIDGDVKVQVNLTCEAKSIQITSKLWEPKKVAVLLTKAVLFKAIRREQSSERIAWLYNLSANELNENATMLQHWFRKHRLIRTARREQMKDKNVSNFYVGDDDEIENTAAPPYSYNDHIRMISSSQKICKESNDESQNSTIDPPNNAKLLREENRAALKIQTFVRLTILKSAMKERPSAISQLRAALKSAEPSPNYRMKTDSFDAARSILCNSMNRHHHSVNEYTITQEACADDLPEKEFISQHAAALAINNIVRTYAVGLQKFRKKKSATLIQAIFRGYRARKTLELEDFSAAVIQFAWSDRRYLRVKVSSAVKIQKRLRTFLCQRDFEMRRFCVTFIQAAWRRAIVRQRMSVLGSSSLMVQSAWRGSKERKQYLKFLSAIRSIQYICKVQHTVTIYKNESFAAIMLQSWLRMQISRMFLARALEAVICVQSHSRSFIQCKTFRKARFSGIMIQSTWRSYMLTKLYKRQKRAAICLQSFLRGRLMINKANRLLRGTVDIQRLFRGIICRRKLAEAISSATKLQTSWRCREKKVSYRKSINAVITLQAFARTVIGKNRFSDLVLSTVLLQKLTRRFLVQSSYKKKLTSARLIQSWRRKIASERRAQEVELASTEIQRIWRAALASKFVTSLRLKKEISSSITIQSTWRGSRERTNFNDIRIAAIIIQSFIRARYATQLLKGMIQDEAIKQSTIFIQSQWRGARARENYTLIRISAIIIQASIRRMLTLQHAKELANQGAKERASILIQSYCRRAIANEKYKKAISSAIIIQSSIRARLKSKFNSSVVIQTYWRGAIARDTLNTARGSAIIIQACVRRKIASRIKEVLEFEKLNQNASVAIQAQWRGAMARFRFFKSRSSAVTLQSAFRRMTGLKRAQRLKRIRSLILVQSFWRGAIARARYCETCAAVIMIQSWARGMISRKKTFHFGNSIVPIQTAFRAHTARIKFQRSRAAAICIQRSVRSYRMRSHRAETASAICIQAKWRGMVARFNFNSYQTSAIHIQRTWRGCIVRKQLHQNHAMATIIQRKWKLKQDERYKEATELSTRIQSFWRSFIVRNKYIEYRAAIIIIQAMIRGAKVRSQFKSCRASIVRIQCLIRGYLGRKSGCWDNSTSHRKGIKVDLSFQNVTETLIFIQSHWRASLTRGKYTQCRVAAMIIQAMVRGVHVRSKWSFVRLLSRKKNLLNGSARKIQIAYIVWRMDIAVWEMRSLAVLLQRGIRGHLARSVVQYALRHLNSSRNSIMMNSRSRLVMDRDREGISTVTTWNRAVMGARTSAAIVIQSCVRRFFVRKQISKNFGYAFDRRSAFSCTTRTTRSAAIKIQRAYFVWSRSRSHSAIKIQKNFRRWFTLKEYHSQMTSISLKSAVAADAATKIQRLQRFRKQREQFYLQKNAVVRIQTSWRKIMAQALFLDMKAEFNFALKSRAAAKIQAFQRCWKERVTYLLKKRTVTRIQNRWRSVLARKSFIRSKAAAVLIQAMYKQYQLHKSRRATFISRVVLLQSLTRGVITRRQLLRRYQESELRAEIAYQQVWSETRDASILIVDKLLTLRESIDNGQCLERLAARVHSALDEADSLSNDDIRNFVHRRPLVIPLPPTMKNSCLPKPSHTIATGTGTPVRCNKTLLVERDFGNSSKTSASVPESQANQPRTMKKPGSLGSFRREKITDGKDADVNLLAKQATELRRKARAVMQRKRRDPNSIHSRTAVVTPHRRDIRSLGEQGRTEDLDEDLVGNKTGPKSFDEAEMPSPIRPREESPDWDWTSEW